MTGDDVSAEPVAGQQRRFQVHRVTGGTLAEGGALQGRCHQVHAEACWFGRRRTPGRFQGPGASPTLAPGTSRALLPGLPRNPLPAESNDVILTPTPSTAMESASVVCGGKSPVSTKRAPSAVGSSARTVPMAVTSPVNIGSP